MKAIRCLFISLIALTSVAVAANEEPVQPERMSKKELLARARQLTQEEFELSKIAVVKAATEKVKQLALAATERGEKLDKQLTDLAAEAGVTEPEKISKPMQERLTVIGKLQGEAFDPDYLKMLLDLHHEHILVLEQLAKRSENAKLRDFAREALTSEDAQLKEVQKLAAPEIPEVKINSK